MSNPADLARMLVDEHGADIEDLSLGDIRHAMETVGLDCDVADVLDAIDDITDRDAAIAERERRQ